MSYEKQTFLDEIIDENGNLAQEGTLLKAEHLQHIEDGIVKVSTVNTIEGLKEAIANGISVITIANGSVLDVNERITLPVGTTLLGNGATLNRVTGFEGILINMSANCKISGLTINGNREAMINPTWDKTIEIATRDNGIVENVTIVDGNECVVCYGNDVIVRDCNITNCGGNGIHFSGADRTRVENCTVIGSNKRSGMGHEDGAIIWSNECNETICVNNYVEDAKCAFGSIDADFNSNIKIIGNTAKNCTQAIEGTFQASVPKNMIITDNHFVNCGKLEINRTDTETIVNEGNWLIANNLFDNTGALIDNVQNVVVSNNISINNNTYHGLYIVRCRNATVESNRISGTYNFQFYVGNCSFVNVIGNNITAENCALSVQNGNTGIVVKGNTLEITGENVSQPCLAGMSEGAIIQGNRLTLKSGKGIQAESNAICTNNIIVCADSSQIAIQIFGGRKNFIVAQNLSNGTFDISIGENCYKENNLTIDALEFATV